jgi:hypothetical protein
VCWLLCVCMCAFVKFAKAGACVCVVKERRYLYALFLGHPVEVCGCCCKAIHIL